MTANFWLAAVTAMILCAVCTGIPGIQSNDPCDLLFECMTKENIFPPRAISSYRSFKQRNALRGFSATAMDLRLCATVFRDLMQDFARYDPRLRATHRLYYFRDDASTFQEATASCCQAGGKLAIFRNDAEFNRIQCVATPRQGGLQMHRVQSSYIANTLVDRNNHDSTADHQHSKMCFAVTTARKWQNVECNVPRTFVCYIDVSSAGFNETTNCISKAVVAKTTGTTSTITTNTATQETTTLSTTAAVTPSTIIAKTTTIATTIGKQPTKPTSQFTATEKTTITAESSQTATDSSPAATETASTLKNTVTAVTSVTTETAAAAVISSQKDGRKTKGSQTRTYSKTASTEETFSTSTSPTKTNLELGATTLPSSSTKSHWSTTGATQDALALTDNQFPVALGLTQSLAPNTTAKPQPTSKSVATRIHTEETSQTAHASATAHRTTTAAIKTAGMSTHQATSTVLKFTGETKSYKGQKMGRLIQMTSSTSTEISSTTTTTSPTTASTINTRRLETRVKPQWTIATPTIKHTTAKPPENIATPSTRTKIVRKATAKTITSATTQRNIERATTSITATKMAKGTTPEKIELVTRPEMTTAIKPTNMKTETTSRKLTTAQITKLPTPLPLVETPTPETKTTIQQPQPTKSFRELHQTLPTTKTSTNTKSKLVSEAPATEDETTTEKLVVVHFRFPANEGNVDVEPVIQETEQAETRAEFRFLSPGHSDEVYDFEEPLPSNQFTTQLPTNITENLSSITYNSTTTPDNSSSINNSSIANSNHNNITSSYSNITSNNFTNTNSSITNNKRNNNNSSSNDTDDTPPTPLIWTATANDSSPALKEICDTSLSLCAAPKLTRLSLITMQDQQAIEDKGSGQSNKDLLKRPLVRSGGSALLGVQAPANESIYVAFTNVTRQQASVFANEPPPPVDNQFQVEAPIPELITVSTGSSVPVNYTIRVERNSVDLGSLLADKGRREWVPANVKVTEAKMVCVYLDKKTKKFSRDGLKAINPTSKNYYCVSNHTTIFAAMLTLKTVHISEGVKIASYTTEVISVISLVFAVFVLTKFRRRLQSDRTVVQINLCLALLFFHLMALLSDLALNFERTCEIDAVFIQFFLLSTAFWMLLEGVTLSRKTFGDAFQLEKSRAETLTKLAVGWGIPLAVVIGSVAFGFAYDTYMALNPEFVVILYGLRYSECWIDKRSALLLWGVVIPVAATLLVNLVIVIKVGVFVFHMSKKTERFKPTVMRQTSTMSMLESNMTHTRASLRAMMLLLPILGIPWCLMLLQITSTAFMYVNVISNGLQGFFLMVIYCFLSNEVRAAMTDLCGRKRGRYIRESLRMSTSTSH